MNNCRHSKYVLLARSATLTALSLQATVWSNDDCQFARDGECDEPNACTPGTDSTDCRVMQNESPTSFIQSDIRTDHIGGEIFLGLAVVAAAAYVWAKGLVSPRSGLTAAVLMAIGLCVLGLNVLPWEITQYFYELANTLGIGPTNLLLLLGLGFVLYVLARNTSSDLSLPTSEVGPRAALSPDVHESENEEVSTARQMCCRISDQLEAALSEAGGRFHLYNQYDTASKPWLQVDRLASDSRGAFIASLRMEFVPQPFKRYPVLINLEVDDRGRRRRVTSISEFTEVQLQSLVTCLMGQGPTFEWKGQRLREWGWQLWRKRQCSAIFESPGMAALRANFKLAGIVIGAALLFVLWSAQPVPVTLLTALGIWVWFRWYIPQPTYRVASFCPPRPPRLLRQLDSWQVVIRDLGFIRESIVDRLEHSLTERMCGAEEPIVIRRENIWHEGISGKVERQQLTTL